MIAVESIRLYQPDAVMKQRLGSADDLAAYIQRLEKETAAYWQDVGAPDAGGLLIVAGVKPGGKARAWCESVEGTIPSNSLRSFEKRLETVPTVTVREGPIAFGLEATFAGRTVEKFPEFSKAWVEAVKASADKDLNIPDDLFNKIWPD